MTYKQELEMLKVDMEFLEVENKVLKREIDKLKSMLSLQQLIEMDGRDC